MTFLGMPGAAAPGHAGGDGRSAVPRAHDAPSATPSCGATSATPPPPSAPSGPPSSPSSPTGRQLRAAGAAIKADVMAELTGTARASSSATSPPAAGWCTGRATPTRRTGSSPAWCAPRGRTPGRGGEGQVDGDPGDRSERGPRRRPGIAAVRDRPRRADRPARRRPPVHILVPGDPPQPGRDPGDLPPARCPAPTRTCPTTRGRWRWPRGPHLRRKFLSARVAVSGANFAVAETGTLAVVESEGNGRMCLTLPAHAGHRDGDREGAAPTWRDLEVFLQLLPRSSTGERMNPYTSMWTGVSHAHGDGPQEFHLVLLDNGRTAALADQVGRSALHCIRCSACLNVCPVYERTGGHAYGSVYPGPIGAVLTPQLAGMHGHGDPAIAAVRVVAVRGLLRRLPGEDRHPVACWCTCAPGHVDGERARRLPTPERAAMAAAAWAMSSPAPLPRRRAGAGRGAAARPGRADPPAAAPAVGLDRCTGRARSLRRRPSGSGGPAPAGSSRERPRGAAGPRPRRARAPGRRRRRPRRRA